MRAFTLIELLIVIGITVVLATISFLNIFNFRGQNDLDLTVKEIVVVLRNAQDRSISQESGSRWGVHFENPVSAGGFYDLFSGIDYSTSSLVSRSTLRSNLQFSDPAGGNSKDIIFSPVSGLPGGSSTIIIFTKNNPSVSSTIIVNSNGQIQY
ncbi:MAG: hypothetical protein UT92_C0001G0009 [Candidatus Curtissbacteria bacterium GW2011_GWA1_40_24]|uniref:Uncharacterized protein n=2 Tax=Patescibacteria group TaxID=1783273 RepID=A0A0G0S0B8_9BACT|nr:MAG: hypothetical protein UT92_C0001G0009 [Candidatus Curtissbacteria bacterium GW2011_GWA1_40_24]KKR89006.1 MAG: hypothetical protein UU38_C0002G0009 [Candidatus Wolfebacteria bacterium GW2011_GWB1_41_12]